MRSPTATGSFRSWRSTLALSAALRCEMVSRRVRAAFRWRFFGSVRVNIGRWSGFDNTAWDRSYYVLYVFVLYYVLYYVLFWPPAGVRRSELFTVTASDLRAREVGKANPKSACKEPSNGAGLCVTMCE